MFLAAVTAGVFGIVVLRQPLLGLIGFVAILASTADFWLGVKYTLSRTEAKRTVGVSTTSIALDQVKRVTVDGNHVKLSPLDEPTRLDAFRGVTLVTTPANREQVLERLHQSIENGSILGD